MPRFSANLGMLFPEVGLIARIDAAATAGFEAVEMQFPYDHAPDEIREAVERRGLRLLGINTPRGDQPGDFGLGALPGREDDFRRAFASTLAWGTRARASAIHVMAGIVAAVDQPRALATFRDNLNVALEQSEGSGMTLLLEPLSPQAAPGYFYSTIARASEMIARIGNPRLKIQFDVFHVARAEGDVLAKLECYMPWIGHVQIAGVPDRHEPDEGEINPMAVFAALDRLGYGGFVGAEYRPRAATTAGLGWLARARGAFPSSPPR